MGTTAKKGAVALMRKTMGELKKSTRNYERALAEWRLIRRRSLAYKLYRRTRDKMQKKRETFGALWQHLPDEVRQELAREFWPHIENYNEAFDHNGLPVRIADDTLVGEKK